MNEETYPLLEEYLLWLHLERGRSPHTLAAYRRDLFAYLEWLDRQGSNPIAVGPDLIEAYLANLRGAGSAQSSLARVLSSVRGFHRYLVEEGHAPHDPTTDIGPRSIGERLPKALDERSVARLIDSVEGDEPLSRRDRALLEFLYGTGCRVSEAIGLDLDRLDLEQGSARVLGKGAKERIVPLGRTLRDALGAWLCAAGRDEWRPDRWARRGDAEAVFLNRRGGRLSRQGAFAAVRKRGVAVGVVLSPHALRHSCATHMLDHGADVRVVQELLGHASVATTQIYTKVSPDHLRGAYLAAHPRAGGA